MRVAERMRGADGVKIAVFRRGRAGAIFSRAAAHAHVMHKNCKSVDSL